MVVVFWKTSVASPLSLSLVYYGMVSEHSSNKVFTRICSFSEIDMSNGPDIFLQNLIFWSALKKSKTCINPLELDCFLESFPLNSHMVSRFLLFYYRHVQNCHLSWSSTSRKDYLHFQGLSPVLILVDIIYLIISSVYILHFHMLDVTTPDWGLILVCLRRLW